MEELFVDVVLPIRPYLKKFIASWAPVEPFDLKMTRCHFSAILFEPLKREHVRVQSKEKSQMTDKITIKMTSSVMKHSKFWFDEETILLIDKRLKAMFDQQLTDFINMNFKKTGDMMKSIELFCAYYEIGEDDVTFEALKKMYYRARTYSTPEKADKIQKIIDSQLSLFG